MKIFNYILSVFTLCFAIGASAQTPGSSCLNADCSIGGSYQTVPNSPSMGAYGCLGSTPNPFWAAVNATSAGNIHFVLQHVADIDFAVYGPFTSVSAGCPITGSTPQVDCSFSASSTEYIDIYGAQPGQVYIILITNFSGIGGTYNLNPAANSTATFNCAINFGGTFTTQPAVCGQPTGSATVNPTGGQAPYTYYWNNVPGNPTSQTVSGLPAGTYTVTVNSSPNPTTGMNYNPATLTVTIPATNPPIAVSTTSTPDICSSSQGTVTATPTSGTGPYTFNWPALGSTNANVTGVSQGTYIVQVASTSTGCTGTGTVVVGNTPATFAATSTLVSCPGGTDGKATATMTPELGSVSYQWSNGQMSQIATGLSAGTYTCVITSSVGCSSTVTATVTEIPGMQGTFTNQTDVSCYTKNDGGLKVNVTQGTSPYSYSWDRSTSTANEANDLYVGTHTVTITDVNGCIITKSATLTEPDPLKITFITPDTQICPEDDLLISVAGTGGSTAYTFTWSSNGVILGTGTSITVDPDVTNTVYCVELTEACDSPPTDTCMTITFPTPIPPHLTPDKYVDCRPGEFFIQNTSPNIQELATTYINFGNNTNAILYNGQDTLVIYDRAGSYTLEVVNTSIYGCVYDTVLIDFLLVNPDPIANFYIGGNPTTIFETTVTAHELASSDVVHWEWLSPHSIPSTSNLEDPKFTFPEDVIGVYPITLIVTSFYGCTDTITLDAIVEDAILFYAPNAFTPDGDEFNQTWKLFVKGNDIYGFNLKVFNRWGEIVWETNDPSVGWDGTYNGKPVQQGMYNWRASLKHKNDDGKEEYKGTVNVLK